MLDLPPYANQPPGQEMNAPLMVATGISHINRRKDDHVKTISSQNPKKVI
jgi:hypothetical protein